MSYTNFVAQISAVMNGNLKLANVLRYTARFGLTFLGLAIFLFALISGSEDYGGGFSGIVQNSPNTLPWIPLLIAIYVAWRWERIGGALIFLLGIFLVYFFSFFGPNFFLSTFIVTSLIPLLGLFLIGSDQLRRRETD